MLSIRTSSILGSAAKRRHSANAPTTLKNADSVCGVPIPFVRVLGFLLWFWFGSFLVLDDAICVVGECGFSQCAVPRSTVPFPMTPPYVGRASSFLLKLIFTHDSRTLPGFALPGVSTTLRFGDQIARVTVRLRTGYAPATYRSIKASIQLTLQSELSHLHLSSCDCSNRLLCSGNSEIFG